MTWRSISPIPIKRRVKYTKRGHAYIDEKTRSDLKRVADSYNGKKLEGALKLIVIIYAPIPKSHKKRVSEQYTCKPDVDNVAKCVMDGLQGVAYKNDSQITKLYVEKMPRDATIPKPRIDYMIEVVNDDE